MPQDTSQFDPSMLAQLAGLELRARYLVDGYLSGQHRSSHRGHSVEFTEHRNYSVGDDLRYVDWKVFGKTDKVYLKQFEAETDLICTLLVDVSESMQFQSDSNGLSKLEVAQCLAAALASIVLRQSDRVSLATFDHRIRNWVRESNSPAQLRRLIEVLESTENTQRSDIGKSLHEFSQRSQRRGIVVVLSDLLDDVESLLSGMKHLKYQRHEVVVLHILDHAELEFPYQRMTRFSGLEGTGTVLTEPRRIRKAYLFAIREYLEHIQGICRSLGVDYELVTTADSLVLALRRVLLRRSHFR